VAEGFGAGYAAEVVVCFAYGGGFACGALFGCLPYGVGLSLFSCRSVGVAGLVVCLWRWPFLVFMSVYLYCPCAGRHSLSLRPQRK
jgi:hypothetical protein